MLLTREKVLDSLEFMHEQASQMQGCQDTVTMTENRKMLDSLHKLVKFAVNELPMSQVRRVGCQTGLDHLL